MFAWLTVGMTLRHRFLLSLVLPLSGFACSSDDDAGATVRAADMAEIALAPVLPLAGAELGATSHFVSIAQQCDAAPQLTTLDACGRELLDAASYAWSDCTLDAPADAPFDTLTSSGSLRLATRSEGSCERGDLALARTLAFELDAAPHEGVHMRTTGETTLARTQLDASQLTIDIAVERVIETERGEGPSLQLAGRLEVELAREHGTRSTSGSLTMTLRHPRWGEQSSTVELIEVLRVAHEQCRWPVGGTVVDADHVLEFSSECGHATLDGEAVELDEIAQHEHRRGRPR